MMQAPLVIAASAATLTSNQFHEIEGPGEPFA